MPFHHFGEVLVSLLLTANRARSFCRGSSSLGHLEAVKKFSSITASQVDSIKNCMQLIPSNVIHVSSNVYMYLYYHIAYHMELLNPL